ncbi:hypothetical protein [Mycolicibacterium aichiense]|uniref:Uncharacterized protein n=1 Tax=Mycolicibacterium aichiense TaxID=1799 RepID=A0A378VC68_9MYCO|nr:hypothetical protein [Mycolicibacterium aichiense]QFG08016.1 MerR-like helix-turn-helix DNA binding domain protein [Mycobacterium phage Herbertwm]MCV7016774.1 hypothetical protein [Mycolicibacterium aichiense]SUA14008.1 Uncharacterised protein [Mycolicibacterium aichiense]SUA14414.1 Uncharacterised protein [Mycolicibacterium aichiense]BBX09443.1 hypothetical protein MAIC_42460 [Mycolicibacterium aichiense]
MRKKHLKAALAQEKSLGDTLISENDQLKVDLAEAEANLSVASRCNIELRADNTAVHAANVKLARRLNEALESNRDLSSKLRRATDLFGNAMALAKPDTGPDRANRQKLTEQEVKDIRAAYRGGMKQKDLAANYGVNPATISRTVRGLYH